MASYQPASACELRAEFKGAFTKDIGQPRAILGWPEVNAVLAQAPKMGEKISWAGIDTDQTIPVFLLFNFATNASQRPKVSVTFHGQTAQVRLHTDMFAAGAAVLNHPFWIGVFDKECGFDLPLAAK